MIRNLNQHLGGFTVRNVTLRTLEQWATARRNTCSAHTFNYELETLRRILDYGVEHGILMENPAHKIKRCKPHKKPVAIPTKDQFRTMLDEMRDKGSKDSADLAELLAYSGCRKGEIVGDAKYSKPPMFWRDVDFELKVFTVTRSKNHEPRTVPLFPAMENFLRELRSRRQDPTNANERILPIYSAKTAITSPVKQRAFRTLIITACVTSAPTPSRPESILRHSRDGWAIRMAAYWSPAPMAICAMNTAQRWPSA